MTTFPHEELIAGITRHLPANLLSTSVVRGQQSSPQRSVIINTPNIGTLGLDTPLLEANHRFCYILHSRILGKLRTLHATDSVIYYIAESLGKLRTLPFLESNHRFYYIPYSRIFGTTQNTLIYSSQTIDFTIFQIAESLRKLRTVSFCRTNPQIHYTFRTDPQNRISIFHMAVPLGELRTLSCIGAELLFLLFSAQ